MAIFYFARRARKLRYYYTLIRLEISRRTRLWSLKCVIVFLARDIPQLKCIASMENLAYPYL